MKNDIYILFLHDALPIDHLRLRYYYNSNLYDIQQILDHEFNDLQSSLPLPTLNREEFKEFIELALSIINEPVELSKFGSKILETSVYDNVMQLVFDKIIELIEIEHYALLPIVSLNLPKLCDH